MVKKSNPEVVDGILGNSKKFKRALVVLIIISIVICYGMYTGEFSKIASAIVSIFN